MKRTLVLLLSLFGLTACPQGEPWEPQDVAMSFGSIPAQICIKVNEARPDMLKNAGDAILERSKAESWPDERRRDAILELHAFDNQLREIVSPGWVDEEGNRQVGHCRVATEAVEVLARNVGDWSNLDEEGWQTAVSGLLRLVNTLVDLLEHFDVVDVYGWLDRQGEIGGSGAGQQLRTFIMLAERFLAGGSSGIRER